MQTETYRVTDRDVQTRTQRCANSQTETYRLADRGAQICRRTDLQTEVHRLAEQGIQTCKQRRRGLQTETFRLADSGKQSDRRRYNNREVQTERMTEIDVQAAIRTEADSLGHHGCTNNSSHIFSSSSSSPPLGNNQTPLQANRLLVEALVDFRLNPQSRCRTSSNRS